MDILHIFELVGTSAFAIAGALIATHKKMDIFGVTVLAIVAAMGGGILRSLLIGSYPIAFLTQPEFLITAMVGGVSVFFLRKHFIKYTRALITADALGLGLFLSIGVGIGLANDYSYWASILLGLITATFGGVMRDVLAAEVPLIFQKELYATIALLGGGLYVGMDALGVTPAVTIVSVTSVVIGLRLLAIKYNWSLPR